MSAVRSILGIVLVLLTSAAHANGDVTWQTVVAIRNDFFTPPDNDAGFTQNTVVSLRRTASDLTFGNDFFHRWLTSREDQRRWDQLELLATAGRPWRSLMVEARAGPMVDGNLGDHRMQNTFHSLTDLGLTLDEGLQFDYPDDHHVGALIGGRARRT